MKVKTNTIPRVAGILANSMIDYPYRIASVIFTQGCNFNCEWCHNRDLIPIKDTDINIRFKDIIDGLNERKGIISGLCISGGEPTLYKHLDEFIISLKDVTSLDIKLDTNGSNPKMLRKLIDKGVLDCVALDVKAPLDNRYFNAINKSTDNELLEKIKESIDIVSSSYVYSVLRTTFIPGLVGIEEMYDIIEYLKGNTPVDEYHLQQFKKTTKVIYDTKLPYTTRNEALKIQEDIIENNIAFKVEIKGF